MLPAELPRTRIHFSGGILSLIGCDDLILARLSCSLWGSTAGADYDIVAQFEASPLHQGKHWPLEEQHMDDLH